MFLSGHRTWLHSYSVIFFFSSFLLFASIRFVLINCELLSALEIVFVWHAACREYGACMCAGTLLIHGNWTWQRTDDDTAKLWGSTSHPRQIWMACTRWCTANGIGEFARYLYVLRIKIAQFQSFRRKFNMSHSYHLYSHANPATILQQYKNDNSAKIRNKMKRRLYPFHGMASAVKGQCMESTTTIIIMIISLHLPIDNDWIRWGLITVAAAFFVTASTEMEIEREKERCINSLC